MILAAGLSPAWQRILEFEQLRPGEVNRAIAVHACASGKVLNVGRACHRLGAPTRTLTVVGGGTGEAIRAEFAAEGLSARWVETQAATRTCTTLIESGGRATELVENAAPLEPDALSQFRAAFIAEAEQADVVVLTGSLPAGVPASLYADLLAARRPRAVLDVRGPELEAVLPLGPCLVKPNRHELEATLGRPCDTEARLIDGLQELRRRGAEWVVVSQGADALWAAGPEGVWRLQPPQISRARNPIGCGDCLAAGIAVGVWRGGSVLESVQLGVAAAVSNLHSLLPAHLDCERLQAAWRNRGDCSCEQRI